jgi:chromosome partitioning protein
MVRAARCERRTVDGVLSDWVVVRNRLSILGSRNKGLVGDGLSELSARLGFRFVDGLAERLAYRELFPRGLTALDDPREIIPRDDRSLFCSIARQEVERLLGALKLPIDDRGRRRAAARAQWFASRDKHLDTEDILIASDR